MKARAYLASFDDAISEVINTATSFTEVECALWVYIEDNRWSEDALKFLGHSQHLEQTVDRLGRIRIEVFSNEHPPPHFHITGPDIDATFRIDNGAFIHGTISKRVKSQVERYFAKNKRKIVAVWNRTRPNGCTVGHVSEDAEAFDGVN